MGDCRAMTKKGWNSKMDLGFPLPEDHLPEGRVCVQFEIPDDQTYAADVIGHIMQLGKWWNWEKGGGDDRRATETAQLFRKAIHETLCVEKYRPMGCNCPDPETYLHRVTDDGGLETSSDGGTTWYPDPTDPRITAPLWPKLPGTDGNEKACQAAANVRENMESKADQIGADATLWAGIAAMIGVLVGLLLFLEIIGTGGALTPFVMALGAALLGAGQSAFNAAMTDAVYETFQCIIYCEMDDTGRLKPGAIDRILAAINADITGIANTFFYKNVQMLGEIGINNMGVTGTGETGDCSGCDCSEGCNNEWFDKLDSGYFYGHISEQTDNYVIVTCDVPNINGVYYGNIWTDSDTLGCYLIDANIEIISSTSSVGHAWRDNPGSGGLVSGLFGGRCINWIQSQSNAPFVIKYTFADCP